MKFSKTTKRVLSLAMTAAVAASSVAVAPAPKEAEAATSYKAYLCFSSKTYKGVRDDQGGSMFGSYVYNGNTKKKISGVKCTDATFKKGKVSFTVSVTGTALKKALSGEKGFNALYVSTSLPGSSKSKLTVTKAVLKIDGKSVKTISKPYLTPDAGKSDKYTQIMIVNSWNSNAEKKYKASALTKVPTKSMSVTITGTLK